jgi:hypothetical protein
MPIIKARTNRVRTVRYICRLQEPNRDTLLPYARFIGDTVDYVMKQLIASAIGKAREFVAWRAGESSGATNSASGRLSVGQARGETDHQR